MKTFSLARIVLVMLLLGCPAVVSAGDWTRFQGPMPADVDANRLPLTWGPTENIAWTADIAGYGQSNPVTWEVIAPPVIPAVTKESGGPGAGRGGMGFGGPVLYAAVFANDRLLLCCGDRLYCVGGKL